MSGQSTKASGSPTSSEPSPGTGGETRAGGGPSGPPDVPGLPVIKDITVSPDKIVAVADVIEEQANALERKITEHVGALSLAPPADDIVSQHAVEAWNTVISDGENSYRNRVLAYVHGLHGLADQLRAAGRRYLADDEDNAASVREAGGS
ncbi:hypothetical protein SacxiDRAFT_2241 [Saccharomonospora xinjiangensis XJ-54]|uniref:PE domain-containing protein n=1 Tax=Saccharomonospora xinjiangensis XJ-54 TaxID=882086 RepID=I0V2W8_9PSEU|nr:hypothetical protein SacxiDRAFT_2241 [Saccharomonospora xinjiangensis XJ-54]